MWIFIISVLKKSKSPSNRFLLNVDVQNIEKCEFLLSVLKKFKIVQHEKLLKWCYKSQVHWIDQMHQPSQTIKVILKNDWHCFVFSDSLLESCGLSKKPAQNPHVYRIRRYVLDGVQTTAEQTEAVSSKNGRFSYNSGQFYGDFSLLSDNSISISLLILSSWTLSVLLVYFDFSVSFFPQKKNIWKSYIDEKCKKSV